jgi:hypothetical protein
MRLCAKKEALPLLRKKQRNSLHPNRQGLRSHQLQQPLDRTDVIGALSLVSSSYSFCRYA